MNRHVHLVLVIVIAAIVPLAEACGDDRGVYPGTALGPALAAACPVADPGDAAARDACANALTDLPELRGAITSPILWGGQPEGVPPERLSVDANLTQFEPRVWVRLYLSTFMFEDAPPRVERRGAYHVVRVPARFRGQLDAGNYPYPFWHSPEKWAAYEQATEVMFVFDDQGQIPVAVRTTRDTTRPHVDREWDGMWTWDMGREPHVSLYSYLFSPLNPHVTRLDTAYRALEESLREQNCHACHDPQNKDKMRHLELLNYPNQALGGRRDIIRLVQANQMPPVIGIPDTAARDTLVERAMEFAAAGDAALAFEGE